MSIVIGADIVPTTNNFDFFEKGNLSALVGGDLKNVLNEVDFRVFNLETPLTDIISPINKCGPTLHAPTSSVLGIKKLDINLFTLANNHIMDQGNAGLVSTIKLLDDNKINHLGAGENIEQARQSYIKNIKGKKIGFYACAEHEFSIASESQPGANPFDCFESFDHIANLKTKCDYIIVLYHGGKEHYRYPSPMLQCVCRKFIEKGANLVVCQHSHCIGCEEKYMFGTIVYGQGNFLFSSCKGLFVRESLLIKINDDFSIEYLPVVKFENGVRLATGDSAKKIISDFICRSEDIKNPDFVKTEYSIFAKKMLKNYLLACSGFGHRYVLRFLNKLTFGRLSVALINRYEKRELLAIRNYLECEAHRELFIEGLKYV